MTTAPKRKTRQQLGDEILSLRAAHDAIARERDANKDVATGFRRQAEQIRKEFDDLKEHLAKSETENQRMRGYIARVQEDDVVREELVTVGDPEGPTEKVPKRIPTQFPQRSPYSEPQNGCATTAFDDYHQRVRREKERPRHWVTYGNHGHRT